MGFLTMDEVRAAYPRVDDSDALQQAKGDRALRLALEMYRPRNWWGTGAGQALLQSARDEGLPLAWVPRRSTIMELNAASDAEARIMVLQRNRKQILQECSDSLDECTDEWIADNVILARRALDAILSGHHEAGMALAVAVGEPLAAWAATPRVATFLDEGEQADWKKARGRSKYPWAQIEQDRAGVGDIAPEAFVYQVLIAPIPRFFTPWRPKDGPPPEALSRHVVAHNLTPNHCSPTNALLAIMLITSIVRQQQEWSEQVRVNDAWDDRH